MIYAFGKGPSTTTVTAPSVGVSTETPITITGTVMDVSPGTRYLTEPDETKTKQNEVALRFPDGVPCVSDESQSAWMEYVYQQQPCPANTVGVQVTLSVIDSNGNYRPIGTTTTNAMGSFGLTWTPDIPGEYTVIANFAGSNSYYSSAAQTYFFASEAPQATPQPTQAPTSMAEQYFLPMSIVTVVAAIAAVGAVILLLLRRK